MVQDRQNTGEVGLTEDRYFLESVTCILLGRVG